MVEAEPMHWSEIEGWFTTADAVALNALLCRVPVGGLVVNVGCFAGRNIAACAEVILERRLNVLAVDTWQGTPGPQYECDDWPSIEADFRAMLAAFGLLERVTVMKKSSQGAAKTFAPTSVDMIFLDADHSEKSVQADIWEWARPLKFGGIISGHDFGDPIWPGVANAVRATFDASYDVRIGPGSTVWWVEV